MGGCDLFKCGCCHDFVRVGIQSIFGQSGLDQLKYPETLDAISLAANQPARAFRQAEAHQGMDQRGNSGDPQHPSPSIIPRYSCDHRVGHEGDHNAEDEC